MKDSQDREKIDWILKFATDMGASKVACLAPESVCVESRLADFCKTPKCPHWGQSMSCPPHVSGPAELISQLKYCKHVIVFRLEIQSCSLHGEDRPEVMRLLHEITAKVEKETIRLGFTQSKGLAGGSCKPSFCSDYEHCRVIEEQKECRHPDHARQSMSGYGVNVGKLMQSAGWSTDLFTPNNDDDQLAWVAGIVLLK